MTIDTPQDLFQHELEDRYDAEHRILKTLPKLVEECENQEAKQAFGDHEKETEQQIKNLEKVFETLRIKAKGQTCYGIQGLIQEHDHFVKEKPSNEVLQMFALSAAGKTEHYEIQSYTGLIQMAKLMGKKDVADLLQENLHQEEAMAKKVKSLDQQIEKETIKAAMAG